MCRRLTSIDEMVKVKKTTEQISAADNGGEEKKIRRAEQ